MSPATSWPVPSSPHRSSPFHDEDRRWWSCSTRAEDPSHGTGGSGDGGETEEEESSSSRSSRVRSVEEEKVCVCLMKPKNDYKGRTEQMSEYIKQLRAYIQWSWNTYNSWNMATWPSRRSFGARLIQRMQGMLSSIISAEAQLSCALELLKAANLQMKTRCDSLEEILKKEKSDRMIDFERKLLPDVIPPHEIGVTLDDIGALEHVKFTLCELIMTPLQRPELFSESNLSKHVKGILLFGAPGTGKTMLAKAIATESGANFMNISMSSIMSSWLVAGDKYVKAIFSLASKLSPAIISIDEVDSMLGKRESRGEGETMRKMKNKFMVNWYELRTKENERVVVIAATNMPYDLDDAVIRRLPRRLKIKEEMMRNVARFSLEFN